MTTITSNTGFNTDWDVTSGNTYRYYKVFQNAANLSCAKLTSTLYFTVSETENSYTLSGYMNLVPDDETKLVDKKQSLIVVITEDGVEKYRFSKSKTYSNELPTGMSNGFNAEFNITVTKNQYEPITLNLGYNLIAYNSNTHVGDITFEISSISNIPASCKITFKKGSTTLGSANKARGIDLDTIRFIEEPSGYNFIDWYYYNNNSERISFGRYLTEDFESDVTLFINTEQCDYVFDISHDGEVIRLFDNATSDLERGFYINDFKLSITREQMQELYDMLGISSED